MRSSPSSTAQLSALVSPGGLVAGFKLVSRILCFTPGPRQPSGVCRQVGGSLLCPHLRGQSLCLLRRLGATLQPTSGAQPAGLGRQHVGAHLMPHLWVPKCRQHFVKWTEHGVLRARTWVLPGVAQ